MTQALEKSFLMADLEAVRQLIQDSKSRDPLSQMSLRAREAELVKQLHEVVEEAGKRSRVALLFGGRPVTGSRAIDASFASRMIKSFVDIVSTKIRSSQGVRIGRRGPLKDDFSVPFVLTSVAQGSFGFVLEEPEADQGTFLQSDIQTHVSGVIEFIEGTGHFNHSEWENKLSELSERTLSKFRDFFKVLRDEGASLKITNELKYADLRASDIEAGWERLSALEIREHESEIQGQLIGLSPISRHFDLKDDATGKVVSGSIGPFLSQSFLTRIESDSLSLGTRWIAKVIDREVLRAGVATGHTLQLVDIQPLTPLSLPKPSDGKLS